MNKKWIGMAAVLVSVATSNGAVIFLEEFDNNNKGYAVTNDVNSAGKWVDFLNKIGPRDIGTAVEGYTTAVSGTETVLAGTVNIGDIQIRSDFDVGITDATLVTNISWRVRSDKNNDGNFSEYVGLLDIQLFHGTNTFGPAAINAAGAGNIQLRQGAGVTSTAKNDGNGWVIFNHSFATGTVAAIRSLRIDAVDYTGTGYAFEVDWLKIEAIPEPATVGMLGLGAVIATLIRRIKI